MFISITGPSGAQLKSSRRPWTRSPPVVFAKIRIIFQNAAAPAENRRFSIAAGTQKKKHS